MRYLKFRAGDLLSKLRFCVSIVHMSSDSCNMKETGDAIPARSCKVPQVKPDVVGDDRWLSMHRRYLCEAKSSEADVLFLGDSIIQQLQFTSLWTEKFSALHCLNFGIGGDRVEHVLWRVLNGELDLSSPVKVVVLFVGTNNTDCTAEDVFEGICEIVKVIRAKLGDVAVVLPTLLPRGQRPNKNRERNLQVNGLLSGLLSSDRHVHVVAIHEDVLQSDQTLSHYIMYDYLHLTNEGYRKVFKPLYDKVEELLHPPK